MAQHPLTLPIVTIDPTFATVIRDVQSGDIPVEKFWVSCYKTSENSEHGKIRTELDETDRDRVVFYSEEADVKFESNAAHTEYHVSSRALDLQKTRILSPEQQYLDAERSNPRGPQRITAFALAPDTSKFATGFLDGSVFIYPVSPPSSPPSTSSRTPPIPENITYPTTALLSSRAHKSTITSLQFFPSNKVLLTASADFSLSIISADLPDASTVPASSQPQRVIPARILKGHTRSITSTGILGVGKSLISSALDGTLRLWDVPSGTATATLLASSPILSTALAEIPHLSADGDELSPPSHPGDRRIEEGKIVYCGLQNGNFEVFDLGIKRSVFRSASGSASGGISSIAHLPSANLLATGSSKGVVALWDVRFLSQPLSSYSPSTERKTDIITSWKRNEAGIESLKFIPSPSTASTAAAAESGVGTQLAIGTADGLPYVARIDPAEGVVVHAELAGGDCDPVRGVAVVDHDEDGDGNGRRRGREVWTAGDDAVVRRYVVD